MEATAILKRFDAAFVWKDGAVPPLAEEGEPPATCDLCGAELRAPLGVWIGFDPTGQYTTGMFCPACLGRAAQGERRRPGGAHA